MTPESESPGAGDDGAFGMCRQGSGRPENSEAPIAAQQAREAVIEYRRERDRRDPLPKPDTRKTERRRAYLIALLRAARLRAQAAIAEADGIGIALAEGWLDPDTAVWWAESAPELRMFFSPIEGEPEAAV